LNFLRDIKALTLLADTASSGSYSISSVAEATKRKASVRCLSVFLSLAVADPDDIPHRHTAIFAREVPRKYREQQALFKNGDIIVR